MSVKKQFMKSKPECKVTFKIGKKEIGNAENVSLLGSFSNWTAIEMDKLKTGDFSVVMTLPVNESFEYKYLIDLKKWINDPEAEAYCDNFMGDENSFLQTFK